MLSLRGPHYLMNAELEELKTILASEKQFSELAYASKYKELGSKKVLLPVATLIVMFSLQVNNLYFFSRKDLDHIAYTANIFDVIFTVFNCVRLSTVISLYGLHLIAAPSTTE